MQCYIILLRYAAIRYFTRRFGMITNSVFMVVTSSKEKESFSYYVRLNYLIKASKLQQLLKSTHLYSGNPDAYVLF